MKSNTVFRITGLFIIFFIYHLYTINTADSLVRDAPIYGSATEAVINEINSAKKEVLVQSDSFTTEPIAQAIVDAKRRGLTVEVILGKSRNTRYYSMADDFTQEGIPTFVEDKFKITHNRIIIDKDTLISVSIKVEEAEKLKTAEKILILKGNKPLTSKCITDFEGRKGRLEKYQGEN